MQTIKVAIVEDNEEIRQSLRILVDKAGGFECIHIFSNAEDACLEMPKSPPHVVLMDIALPEMDGIDCIRKLKAQMPKVQFMVFSVFEDDDRIFNALKAGANGYILKKSAPTAILEAIKEIHNGGSPMSSQIARRVVAAFHENKNAAQENNDASLSKREIEISDLLAKGYMYKEIAQKLSISTETVRKHVHNIYDKLHVQNRTEALNKLFKKK